MKKNPWFTLLVLIIVFGLLYIFIWGSVRNSVLTGDSESIRATKENSILHLQLTGVIVDGKKFLKQLKKYRKDPKIKAIVVEINSPGGVVGPSQEIHAELVRVREDLDKPLVVYSGNLLASGAYYSAVAADQIIVTPGAMVGSIGVIMEFVNLEKLYDWAKVSRFTITTGKYKDSGSEYRAMRDDERKLFQDMIDEVYQQFTVAISEGRDLSLDYVKQYADGRVFTGAQAVERKFADEIGTLEDAFDVAADLAGIKDNYDIFEPPKRKPSLFDLFSAASEDDEDNFYGKAQSHFKSFSSEKALFEGLDELRKKLLKSELNHRPLFLMPGVM